jgi:spore germination protein YaaH
MTRPRIPIAIMFVLVVTLATSAAGTAAPAKRSSRGCTGGVARGLAFAPLPKATAGRLAWKRPGRGLPPGGRYRVLRDGKVVGDTKRRSMRIAVAPGRRYTFVVRVVSRSGQASSCRAVLRWGRALRAPSAPSGLAVASLTPTQVTLVWDRSRAGDAPIAGYRILRNGARVKQIAATNVTLPIASLRTFDFAVTAVDTRGNESAPSPVLRVVTDHAPPSPPGRPTATEVGQSELRLTWPASAVAAGRIVGYRVFRDGTPVAQVPAAEAVVSRLFAARLYTFTVVAVDSFGFLSTPSPPLTVSTNPPPATQGHAHAFLLASTDRAYDDFVANYMSIGTVYPTYYACDRATLEFRGVDDPRITEGARIRQVKVMPRFDCQGSAQLHRIFTEPAARQAAIDAIAGIVQTHGYDGANVDFEAGLPTDRPMYTAFMADLAARLHASGKELSIDVSSKYQDSLTHPRSALYDYAALGRIVDTVFVMGWGIHWTTSAPGPISDLPWFTKVADYVATMPDKGRFVMGMPFYGVDWPAGGGTAHPGTPLEHASTQARAAQFGVTPVFDPVSAEGHFAYTDSAGVPHDVWFINARSVSARVQVAKARGLGGVGFWRLGDEDQTVWADPALVPGALW